MRIAVACDSLTDVARHIGRAPFLLVYDEVNGKPVLKEQRVNPQAAVGADCASAPAGTPSKSRHERLIEALSDCTLVVARGIGQRIADELMARDIKPAVVDRDVSPFDAAALAIAGKATGTVGYSGCGQE